MDTIKKIVIVHIVILLINNVAQSKELSYEAILGCDYKTLKRKPTHKELSEYSNLWLGEENIQKAKQQIKESIVACDYKFTIEGEFKPRRTRKKTVNLEFSPPLQKSIISRGNVKSMNAEDLPSSFILIMLNVRDLETAVIPKKELAKIKHSYDGDLNSYVYQWKVDIEIEKVKGRKNQYFAVIHNYEITTRMMDGKQLFYEKYKNDMSALINRSVLKKGIRWDVTPIHGVKVGGYRLGEFIPLEYIKEMKCEQIKPFKQLPTQRCFGLNSSHQLINNLQLYYIDGRLAQIAQKALEKIANPEKLMLKLAEQNFSLPRIGKQQSKQWLAESSWLYRNAEVCMEKQKERGYNTIYLVHSALIDEKKSVSWHGCKDKRLVTNKKMHNKKGSK